MIKRFLQSKVFTDICNGALMAFTQIATGG